MNKKISIIVPVYSNLFLKECILSLMAQTYSNLEFIFVLDGQRDNSKEIVQEFQRNDNRIKIFIEPNLGVANARNIGLLNASGDFISFVDSDDLIDSKMCEKLAGEFRKNKEIDLICFGLDIFGDENVGDKAKDCKYYDIKFDGIKKFEASLFSKIDGSVCNKIFKKDIIIQNNIKFPFGLRYEDCAFCIKYLSVCRNLFFIKDKFYKYRRRQNSTMAKTFAGCDFALEHLFILDDIFQFFIKNEKFEEFFDVFVEFFVSFFYFSLNYSTIEKRIEVLNSANYLAHKFFIGRKIENKLINCLLNKDFEAIFEKDLKFYQKIFSLSNNYSILTNEKEKYLYFLGKKFLLKKKKEVLF